MAEIDFSFNINLEWLASLSCAISLWERPIIKKKMKLYFTDGMHTYKEKDALTREVMDEVIQLGLPQGLALDVQKKIIVISKNMFNWTYHVTNCLNFDIAAADLIYWTPYATVDQSKIFKLVWSKDMNLFFSNQSTWLYVACVTRNLHIVKNHLDAVKDILNKYKNCRSESEDERYLSSHDICRVLLCVLKYFNYDISRFGFYPNWLDPNKSVQANFFQICVLNGCPSGVKHFWNEMTVLEQEENVLSGIVNCKRLYNNCGNSFDEILRFLLGGASSKTLQKVLNDNHLIQKILKMFAHSWPWEQCYSSLMELKLLNVLCLKGLLTPLLSNIRNEYDWGYDSSKSMYRRYFQVVFNKIPSVMKDELVKKNHTLDTILFNLLSGCDFTSAKMIFDLEISRCLREKILADRYCVKVYQKWVINKKYDVLQKFMDEILVSDVERCYFKREIISFYNIVIESGSLDDVDKLLDWQKTSEEDREMLKSKINAYSIYGKLTENRKDEFLNWYFTLPEEITSFHKIFKAREFLRDRISKIWTKSGESSKSNVNLVGNQNFVDFAKEESAKCLACFLDSREIVQFKKYMIMDYRVPYEVLKSICQENHSNSIKILKGFLSFCTNESEEESIHNKPVLETKIINNWISILYCRFDLIQALINLISKDEIEKLEIIQNYMSTCGEVLCSLLLRRKAYEKSHFINFLNTWVKPCENIAVIRIKWKIRIDNFLEKGGLDLARLDDNYFIFLHPEVIQEILFCFEKLEKGNDVEFDDISLV